MTVAAALVVPVKVGVLIFVTLSVLEVPVSLAVARSGVLGVVAALVGSLK